jgi:hypothetical protein
MRDLEIDLDATDVTADWQSAGWQVKDCLSSFQDQFPFYPSILGQGTILPSQRPASEG